MQSNHLCQRCIPNLAITAHKKTDSQDILITLVVNCQEHVYGEK
jgi:hypothetical protein